MRILRITPLPPDFVGGLSLYCKNLSLNLAKRNNVKSDILTPDLFNKGVKSEDINDSIRIIYKKNLLFPKKYFLYPVANIFKYIKDNYKNYDIIHVHGYYFSTTTQCAILRKIRTFPLVLHIHGGIQTPYNSASSLLQNFQLLIKEKIFDASIGRFHIRSADKLISVAKNDVEVILKKYNVNKRDCVHIPNGVDLTKFKRESGMEREYITLLATRLSYVKGIDIYIKIIKELYKQNKNLKFLVIGEGHLENLIFNTQKKIPIKFLSHVPYEKIQNIYNKSKLLLITSRSEGVPNIIYESLACETPVISSNVGGISNVIADGENGYTYEIKNIKKIIPKILELIENEEKLQEFGRNGRKLIEREYSWDVVTNKVLNIYKEMIG